MCFDKKFYVFVFLKHLFQPISDRFGACFRPYQPELENEKKNLVTDAHASASKATWHVHVYQTRVHQLDWRTRAFQLGTFNIFVDNTKRCH